MGTLQLQVCNLMLGLYHVYVSSLLFLFFLKFERVMQFLDTAAVYNDIKIIHSLRAQTPIITFPLCNKNNKSIHV